MSYLLPEEDRTFLLRAADQLELDGWPSHANRVRSVARKLADSLDRAQRAEDLIAEVYDDTLAAGTGEKGKCRRCGGKGECLEPDDHPLVGAAWGTCSECDGTGEKPPCGTCGGSGLVITYDRDEPSGRERNAEYTDCPDCGEKPAESGEGSCTCGAAGPRRGERAEDWHKSTCPKWNPPTTDVPRHVMNTPAARAAADDPRTVEGESS